MKIELGNNYYIDADELNYTLKQAVHVDTYTDKSGKVIESHEKIITIGYYRNFEQCVKGMLEHQQIVLARDLSLSLKEYAQFVSESNKTAVQAFKTAYKAMDDDLK